MRKRICLLLTTVALVSVVFGQSVKIGENDSGKPVTSQPRPYDSRLNPMCLHTEGNRVLDAGGKPVRLYGVNIASLEWSNGGDHLPESVTTAISDWKVNCIRLPFAQDRWFGRVPDQSDGGAAYRTCVDKIVDICAKARVYIDLDLHWSDCGQWADRGGNPGQHNLPDTNSIAFWQDAAVRYRNHPNVIFGLYNEPHDVSFAVWRDGGTVTDKPAHWNPDQRSVVFAGVGMQTLYDTVRMTGATNVVTVSGLDWGFDLSGVLGGYAISGTNLVYETHPYPFKGTNWDYYFGDVSRKFPVFVGEWGFGGRFGRTNDLEYAGRLMDYTREHDLHWTAWDLHTTAGPALIKNWQYEPTLYGQFVKTQLAAVAVRKSDK
jgi:endoglucanase